MSGWAADFFLDLSGLRVAELLNCAVAAGFTVFLPIELLKEELADFIEPYLCEVVVDYLTLGFFLSVVFFLEDFFFFFSFASLMSFLFK